MRRICALIIVVSTGLGIGSTVFAAPFMYVAMGNTNELIKIDLNTNAIIGRIGELENAHGLAGHPKSEYLVAGSMMQNGAGSSSSKKPSTVSEQEHKEHHSAASGRDGSDKTQKSYVSIVHPKHGHVMRRVEVGGITHHTAISADGRTAVAVHSKTGSISVIDLDTMRVKKVIGTGQVPNYAVFSQRENKLYVSNAGSGSVSVIDTKNWQVINKIEVGMGPEHLALAPNGKALYVLNVVGGSISRIDTSSERVTQTYKAGKSPHGVAVSPDSKHLYVSNKGSNDLYHINLATGKRDRMELNPAPYHLEYVAQNDRLYVSSRKKPIIWVIEPKSLKIVETIKPGAGVAHQMVILEK